MSKKTLAGISAAAILSILAGNAYAAATADENGITPLQWYKFDGNMTQMGSGSTGWADNGSNYIDALDGKAMSFNGSVSPYTGSFATGDGSWTIVTMAKGAKTANPSIIFSNGQSGNSGFALATSNAEENNVIIRVWGGTGTLSGYEAAEGNYTDIIKTTVADVTAFHLYALSYDSEAHTLTLKIDGTAAGSLSGITYTHRGEAQLGGIHGGSTAGLSRTTGVSMDDFRVYGQVLTDAQLSQVAATFVGGFLPDFAYRAIAGQAPTGWFSGWEYNSFDGSRTVLGPTADSVIYMTAASGNNHPGSGLTAKDKRTFAVYANLELMTVNENTTHTLLGVGGSYGSGANSINLVRVGNEIKLGYIKGGAAIGYSNGINIENTKGWHLYVFSYDSEVGTTLSMDGGTPVTDTSDNAKFVPTAGMQIGVTWQGYVFSGSDNAAIAQVLGYDAVLTEAQIAKVVQNYPAVSTLSTDFNYNVANGSITVPSLTVNAEKYFGASNGTINIPAGVEIATERVRMVNSADSNTSVTANIAGKITITKETENSNVWSGGTGVLFGHYRGTGTYNISGEIDASKAFIELRYSAGEQVINLNGGTMKAKGIYYVDANGSTGDVKVNASNGATIETMTATGFVAPLEVTEGDVTITTTESYTNGKAITVTGGNLIFDVAEGKTLTLTGAITGEGTITKKGAGTLVVPNTDVVIKYEAGTITLPDGFTGTVDRSAKAMSNWDNPAGQNGCLGKHGSTVVVPSFTGNIAQVATIDTTLELTGDFHLNSGFSPYTTTITGVKGTGKFSVTPNLNNSYQIKIGEVSGSVTFGVGGKNVLILPASYTGTVDGAVAKFTDNDGNVHYCARIDEALAGKTPGDDVSNVTILSGSLPAAWAAYTVDENGKIVLAKSAAELFLEGIAAGGEVELTSDIEISETIVVDGTVTLNLGNSTITTTVAPLFKVTGSLTINGGTLAGPTGADGAALDSKSMITVVGGTLTYNSGTLTCGGSGSDGMYGVSVHDRGTATFGTSEGGPSISSHFAAVGANNTTAPVTITINNGSYTSAATTDTAWWFYFCAAVYAPGSGDITINGGSFSGKYGVYTRYSNVEQNLTINGGTFTSTATDIGIDTKTGSGYVGSGIRTITVGSNELSIPEGYVVSEGKVVVKPEGPTSWSDIEDVTTVIELPEGAETTVTTDQLTAWATANKVEFTAGITIPVNALIFNVAPDAVPVDPVVAADTILEELASKVDISAMTAGTLDAATLAKLEKEYPMAKIELKEVTTAVAGEGATNTHLFKLSIELK